MPVTPSGMTPERWQAIKDVLAAALEREPAARAAYLAEVAARDAELGREAEDLLAANPSAGFLEQPMAPVEPLLRAGTQVGAYEVQSVLGAGGMGQVFLARDRTLDRPVALKFLPDTLQRNDAARQRFLREAKAAAALDHPYICKIYQTGEDADRPFIAMEYVRGDTLQQRLKDAPLTLAEAVQVAVEVAEAVETAHDARIVHRDLKPSNIMLTTGGHVKVLDFGLAKRVTHPDVGLGLTTTATHLTQDGAVQGTVPYMSPEQVRGEQVDGRSDLFSLGVVLYEIVAGEHPFPRASTMETAAAILHEPAPPLGAARAVPPLLEQVIGTLLAKAPEERYQEAHALRADLVRVQDLVVRGSRASAAPSSASRVSTGVAGRAPLARWRRPRVAAAAVLTVLTATVTWWAVARTVDPGPLSVAVVPLTNVSQDPDDDYLANGIAQAVTTRLHGIGMRVIPWETSRRYGGDRDALEVASTLNVHAVMGGSLQTDGDRVLVTVQLFDSGSGFISWTGEFEERLDDVFEVQARIARGVATSLGHELTPDDEATLTRPESSSAAAYDLYLQGTELLMEEDQESTSVASEYFGRAVEIDPTLVDAHVGLGSVYAQRFFHGWGGGAANLDLAEASYQTALDLDPADLRARRGLMVLNFDRGHSEAVLRHGQEVARLGPSDDIETLMARAHAYALGGLPEVAVSIFRRVLELDPSNEFASWLLPYSLLGAGQYPETLTAGDAYRRQFGDAPFVMHALAVAQWRLGDRASALDSHVLMMQRLMDPSIDPAVVTWYEMWGLVGSGVRFEQAGQRREAEAQWRRGIEIVTAKLDVDPDSIGMRLMRGSLLGLLGDRAALVAEEARARELMVEVDVNPSELVHVAAAYAHLGEPDRAVAVLHEQLRRGGIIEVPFNLDQFASIADEPAFLDFRREYDAEKQRLLERYAPTAPTG